MGLGWIHFLAKLWRQTLGGVGALSLAAMATATTNTDWIHPTQLPQPSNAPAVLMAYVEIPKGGSIKYELDPESGHVAVDRFLPESWSYPHAYGFVPDMPAADGDALDVFIVTDQPLRAQSLIRVHPIGLIRLLDGDDADHKLVAAPVAAPDRVALDEATIAALKTFLTGYKAQPGQDNPIEWLAVDDQAKTLKWLDQKLPPAVPDQNRTVR